MSSEPVRVAFHPSPTSSPGRTVAGPTAVGPRPAGRRPARRIGRPRRLGSLSTEDKVIVAILLGALLIAFGAGPDLSTATAPEQVAVPAGPTSAAPRGTGCTEKDPTGGKCITPTTAHGIDQLVAVFGPLHAGPNLRSAGCWDAHAWNPTSDHPKGKGCDLVPGHIKTRAAGADLDHGWAIANWLRRNAGALQVNYVIWQGRIWSVQHPNDVGGGWGRAYTGGGVYDPANVTGGHWDHVHVSFLR